MITTASMIRFWKKFVHRDGSYDAGGVQGRYVYSTSWPAVGMRMMMRMIMMLMMMRMRMIGMVTKMRRGMVMLKTMHT